MSIPAFVSVHTFNNGQSAPAKVTQLHEPYGPFVLNGKRLDLLEQVEVVLDSSTKTSTQTGNTESSAKTGNMVKRAVVGGVLLGGAGAAVGAVTGKREGKVETVTTESLNTKLTLKLIFGDGSTQHAIVNNIETYHWLIALAESPATSDEELQVAEQRASDDRRYKEAVSKVERPVYNAQKLRKVLDRGVFLLVVFISAIISFKLALAVVAAYILALMFGKSFLDSKEGTDEQKHADYVSKISAYMGKPCEIPFPNEGALAAKQSISGVFTLGFVLFVLLVSKAAHNKNGGATTDAAESTVAVSTASSAPKNSPVPTRQAAGNRELHDMIALLLNKNDLLCAEVLGFTALKQKDVYEVECIQFRKGKGRKTYILDMATGSAWEP